MLGACFGCAGAARGGGDIGRALTSAATDTLLQAHNWLRILLETGVKDVKTIFDPALGAIGKLDEALARLPDAHIAQNA